MAQLLPIVHSALYSSVKLPAGHRYPMQKFDACYRHLLASGLALPEQIIAPSDQVEECDLQRAHSPQYLAAFRQGQLDSKAQRVMGLPWSPQLVRRTLSEVSGTLLTARLALQHGRTPPYWSSSPAEAARAPKEGRVGVLPYLRLLCTGSCRSCV